MYEVLSNISYEIMNSVAVYCDKMTKVTKMQTTNILELVTRRQKARTLANADERMNQMRATLATSKLPPYRDL